VEKILKEKMLEEVSAFANYITLYRTYKKTKEDLDELYIIKKYCKNHEKKITKQFVTEMLLLFNHGKKSHKDILFGASDDPEKTLVTINKIIQNKRLKKIQQKQNLSHYLELFIILTLPDAMIKREFDIPMSSFEEAILMELIPKTTTHSSWDLCQDTMTIYIKNIRLKRCRQCGKKKINHLYDCKLCHMVSYCSGRCKRSDMEDKVFGHEFVECVLFENCEYLTK